MNRFRGISNGSARLRKNGRSAVSSARFRGAPGNGISRMRTMVLEYWHLHIETPIASPKCRCQYSGTMVRIWVCLYSFLELCLNLDTSLHVFIHIYICISYCIYIYIYIYSNLYSYVDPKSS